MRIPVRPVPVLLAVLSAIDGACARAPAPSDSAAKPASPSGTARGKPAVGGGDDRPRITVVSLARGATAVGTKPVFSVDVRCGSGAACADGTDPVASLVRGHVTLRNSTGGELELTATIHAPPPSGTIDEATGERVGGVDRSVVDGLAVATPEAPIPVTANVPDDIGYLACSGTGDILCARPAL